MGKATLHNLIDLLNENDIDIIYNILIRFIPSTNPLPDEIDAINQGEIDIENGDVFDLNSVDWDNI